MFWKRRRPTQQERQGVFVAISAGSEMELQRMIDEAEPEVQLEIHKCFAGDEQGFKDLCGKVLVKHLKQFFIQAEKDGRIDKIASAHSEGKVLNAQVSARFVAERASWDLIARIALLSEMKDEGYIE